MYINSVTEVRTAISRFSGPGRHLQLLVVNNDFGKGYPKILASDDDVVRDILKF
jgi:hypothetical protein